MHNMKFLNLGGLRHFYDKYIRPLKGAAYKEVANNLTTEEDGSVLDARQGKNLEDKKVNKTSIINSLLTTEEGYALDARQGKVLDDKISDINAYLSNISDYIVEEGTNANGSYRKWDSGKLEMWHSANATCAIGTAAGTLYTSQEFTLEFPIESKTACFPVFEIIANGAIWGSASGSANSYRSSFKYHLFSAALWNLASFSYSYYAIGTWK